MVWVVKHLLRSYKCKNQDRLLGYWSGASSKFAIKKGQSFIYFISQWLTIVYCSFKKKNLNFFDGKMLKFLACATKQKNM